jgi:hypothetical protein
VEGIRRIARRVVEVIEQESDPLPPCHRIRFYADANICSLNGEPSRPSPLPPCDRAPSTLARGGRSRELPNLPLEDALQLVRLYAERGSPKYEKAAMRWLERYLTERSPRLRHFAEITASLAKLKG